MEATFTAAVSVLFIKKQNKTANSTFHKELHLGQFDLSKWKCLYVASGLGK